MFSNSLKFKTSKVDSEVAADLLYLVICCLNLYPKITQQTRTGRGTCGKYGVTSTNLLFDENHLFTTFKLVDILQCNSCSYCGASDSISSSFSVQYLHFYCTYFPLRHFCPNLSHHFKALWSPLRVGDFLPHKIELKRAIPFGIQVRTLAMLGVASSSCHILSGSCLDLSHC